MRATAAVPLLLALCACGKAAQAPPALVSDSAGIHLVQYSDTSGAPVWRVDAGTGLVLGAGSDTTHLFRVTTALRLDDGRILVGDGGDHRLLLFDASGRLERLVGHEGEGPGEFKDLSLVSDAWPDSLLVWDAMARRLSVFDRSGTFVRSFGLATTDSVPYASVTGVYADGSFAAASPVLLRGPVPTGRHAFRTTTYHFDRDGGYIAGTGDFATSETYVETFPGGFSVAPVLFGRRTYRLVSGNGFVFVSTDRYELRFYRSDGVLVRIVRRTPLARVVTSGARAAEEKRLVDETPESRRDEVRKTLASEDVPELLPEIAGAVSDGLGRIWVQAFMPGDAQAGEPWWVYGTDGSLLGKVELPAGFRLTDAGSDFVLGVQKDDLGVESVVRMRLLTR
jgi:hypothetical protein